MLVPSLMMSLVTRCRLLLVMVSRALTHSLTLKWGLVQRGLYVLGSVPVHSCCSRTFLNVGIGLVSIRQFDLLVSLEVLNAFALMCL